MSFDFFDEDAIPEVPGRRESLGSDWWYCEDADCDGHYDGGDIPPAG